MLNLLVGFVLGSAAGIAYPELLMSARDFIVKKFKEIITSFTQKS